MPKTSVPATAAEDAPTPKELAQYDFNDYGNALRLIRLCGGAIQPGQDPDTTNVTLLFQKGFGWVAFNGRYWDRNYGEDLARRKTHEVAVKLKAAFNELVITSAKPDSKVAEFCERTGMAGASSAMLRQAESYLAVPIEAFDREPMALNFRNGTLWLVDDKGRFKPRLRPHRASDRITRYIDFDYNPKADCDEFRKTLRDSLPEGDKRDFFQRAMAYSTTGSILEQAFFLCQGLGQDGKSTLLNAIRIALGGYGGVGDVKTFLDIGQVGASNASPDLAKLAGDVRMVMLSEPPRDARLNEALIKQWTGGDPVQARELREKPFEFYPVGKLWLQCNAFPVAKGNDDGIWRRTYPILFENQVPNDKIDRKLLDRIKANELPGIINWLIAGVGDWLDQGLNPPPCVLEAREQYRKQSSPFMDWLTERCVYGKAAKGEVTKAKDLLDDYKAWAERQGHEKPMGATGFGRALTERQIKPLKRHGNISRTPIRLKTGSELRAEGLAPIDDDAGASATSGGQGDLEAYGAFGGEDEQWRE